MTIEAEVTMKIDLNGDQVEEIVRKELATQLTDDWGIPKKTLKAIRRVYKWYTPHGEAEAFFKALKNDWREDVQ